MKRRFFAGLLSLSLVSLFLASALAVEGGGTLTEDTPTCTCETLCTEGSVSADCPVCGVEGADLTQCTGTAATDEPTTDEPATDTPETEGPASEEPAGNTPETDPAVEEAQAVIDALPPLESLYEMGDDDLQAALEQYAAAYEVYDALTGAQKAQLTGTEGLEEFMTLMGAAVPMDTTNVSYVNAAGVTRSEVSATVVESSTNAVTWSSGWYVVNNNVTISERITVSGSVNLILADGFTLNASKGIAVTPNNTLTIWGQSNGTGTLNAGADTQTASIGGNQWGRAGTIEINGGTIIAKGGADAAGIGGGRADGNSSSNNGGTIRIHGGTVTATGSGGGAGIGGGQTGGGGSITITGGIVSATGGGRVVDFVGAVGAAIGRGGNCSVNVGSFSTGSNGTAVIYATPGGGHNGVEISDTSSSGSWGGIIFQGNSGQVYGNQTLSDDVRVTSGRTLTIPAGTTLTVGSDTTLTVNGTLTVDGTLTINGNIAGSGTINPESKRLSAEISDFTAGATSSTQISITSPAKVTSPTGRNLTIQYACSTSTTAPTVASAWTTSKTFTGLTPDTTYYIFARAIDGLYKSDTSTGKEVTTPKKASVSSEPTARTGLTYNGSSQDLVNAGTASNGDMMYLATTNNSKPSSTTGFPSTIPSETDAGTYYVWYYAKGTDGADNSDIAGPVTVSIGRYTLNEGDVEWTYSNGAASGELGSSLTYNGTAYTITASITGVNDTPLTLTVSGGASGGAAITNVDTYNLTAALSTTDARNYQFGTTDKTSVSRSVEIKNGTPAYTAPTAKTDLTYTGEAKELVNSGSATNGTMEYAVSDSNLTAPATGWGTGIPEGTNAGTYYVWYKVQGNSGYNNIGAMGPVEVNIGKATVNIPAADSTPYTYNGQEQTYQIAASDYYTVGNNTRTDAGSQEVTVTLTDTANYRWSDGSTDPETYTFTINKCSLNAGDVTWSYTNASITGGGTLTSTDDTITYNGDAYVISAKIAGVGSDGDLALTVSGGQTNGNSITDVGSGSYELTAALTDDQSKNYEFSGNPAFTVKVDKHTLAPSAVAWTYANGASSDMTLGESITYNHLPYTISASIGGVKNTPLTLDVDGGESGSTITNVWARTNGQYTLTASLTAEAAANYQFSGTPTKQVTMNPASLNAENVSWTYTNSGIQNGAAQALGTAITYNANTYTIFAAIEGQNEESLTLAVTGGENGGSTITNVGGGSYTLGAALTGDNAKNYTFGENQPTKAVAVNKADPQGSAGNIEVTYNGQPVPADKITGGMSINGGTTTVPGTWSWESTAPANVSESGDNFKVKFTPDDTANYNAAERTITVTIKPKVISLVWSYDADGLTYDGQPKNITAAVQDGDLCGSDQCYVEVSGGTEKNVGTHTARATSLSNDNYALPADVTYEYTITAQGVPVPAADTKTYTYIGQEQTYTLTADDRYTIENATQTSAGTYTVTVALNDTANYEWTTGGTEDQKYTFIIEKAEVTFQVGGTLNPTYDGQPHTADVTVTGSFERETPIFSTAYRAQGDPSGAASVIDAGAYDVWVTLTNSNYKFTGQTDDQADADRSMDTGTDLTIAPKGITVSWKDLQQTYDGTAKAPTPVFDGLVPRNGATALDTVEVDYTFTGISGRPTNAGSYPFTAVSNNSNYVLTAGASNTLTIDRQTVYFTVMGSAYVEGETKAPTITPSVAGVSYTITYRQNGQTVGTGIDDFPSAVGTYEIWAAFDSNGNYQTASGLQGRIGTYTVSARPPVIYTVTFANGAKEGETITGTAPAKQEVVSGTAISLPDNPFTHETEGTGETEHGFIFTGWSDGGSTLYQPGDLYTVSRNVTLTAQWQSVYHIKGSVTDQKGPVSGAVVRLMFGAQQIAEASTDATGSYDFDHVLPGIYNLVVSHGERTITTMETITDHNETNNATLPAVPTNSIVSVQSAVPVVVGNLEKTFDETDEETATGGGKVEMTFTAQEKAADDSEISNDIEAIQETAASNVTLGLVMDYSVQKDVYTKNESGDLQKDKNNSKPVTETSTLLTLRVTLPGSLQGMYSYHVYRYHGAEAEAMKQNPAADEEGFVLEDGGTTLVIYAKKFSTYAIGYVENAPSSGATRYPPVVTETDNGSVTVSPSRPTSGQLVTIRPEPDEGYEVDEVTVTTSRGTEIAVTDNGDGTYSFRQPSGSVTITVTFKETGAAGAACPRDGTCPLAKFTDVVMDSWYHDGIHYCVEHGLMGGTSATTFSPDTTTSRAMIAVILWRQAGSPTAGEYTDFPDVADGLWYTQAIRWASSAGVVGGYPNGSFGPNDPITREQLAAMLYRYAQYQGVEAVTLEENLGGFTDADKISGYAVQAMNWAVGQGVMGGYGDGTLGPQGEATRAQAAAMLQRFCERIGSETT